MDALIIEMMLKNKAPYPCEKKKEEFFVRVCIVCVESKGTEHKDECVYGCKLGEDDRVCIFSDSSGYVTICSEYNHCLVRKTKHDPKTETHGYCQDCLTKRIKK